jgi:hypothetical protein
VKPRAYGRCPDCGQEVSGRAEGEQGDYVVLRPHTAPAPLPGRRLRRVVCLPRFTRRAVRRLPDPAPVS